MLSLWLSLVAAIATCIGSLLPLFWMKRGSRSLEVWLGASAGVLLAIAFVHLVPEATAGSELAALAMAGGFLTMFILEQAMTVHACPEESEQCELHRIGVLSFIGLAFHSLLDGLALVVSFAITPVFGMVTFLGVLLHEFPEGVITASLMSAAGYKRRAVLGLSAVVAFATPAGALLSIAILSSLNQSVLAGAMGFAAGNFIYVGATDLMPRIHRNHNLTATVAALGGFLLIVAIKLLLPE